METAADSPSMISTPLRAAAFRRFVSANLISTAGSAMAPLALAYSVIEQGGGAGSLGLVLAMNTVPTIVFLLAGGLFADRLSRSKILFFGNLLAAGAQGALAVTVATGHATTASIAVCGFVSGTAASFIVPATQGAVAQIVPAEYLQQANALLRLPSNMVKVLGPVVGGFVVAASGAAWALAWDAFTFTAAAFLLLGLRLDAPSPPAAFSPICAPDGPASGHVPGCGPIRLPGPYSSPRGWPASNSSALSSRRASMPGHETGAWSRRPSHAVCWPGHSCACAGSRTAC